MTIYSFVPSAKGRQTLCTISGKSFTKKMNNNEPNIEPWGILEIILLTANAEPFTMILFSI